MSHTTTSAGSKLRQDRLPEKPRRGLAHLIDAAGYSWAGLTRLWQETATRLEMAGFLAGSLILAACGARFEQWMVYVGLCFAVLAVEAINTAVEVLTDRVSPEWSQDAKHAKDLGSLAVGLVVLVTMGHVAMIVLGWR